jgi:hypothetical protein
VPLFVLADGFFSYFRPQMNRVSPIVLTLTYDRFHLFIGYWPEGQSTRLGVAGLIKPIMRDACDESGVFVVCR